jgi:cation:H+ antiporter
MTTFDMILLFIAGLLLIIKGGDWFVDSSIWIAKKTHIPSIIIGATIVSIGTTIPELCVSTFSIIKSLNITDPTLIASYNEMAVGNAIGSMLCNIALILALVLCIRPPKTEKSFNWKAIFLFLATLALTIFTILDGEIVLWEGITLLIAFVAFITLNLIEARQQVKLHNSDNDNDDLNQKPIKVIGTLFLGAAAIALGANLLVDKGQALATLAGIPTQIVAVTFVALGTSLPELVTAITSLKKKDADIGIGNIIGANIINCTLLIGLASTISGSLPIDYITKTLAIYVLMAITSVLIFPPLFKSKTYRWQGYVMLALYFGFMVYNVIYVAQGI